MIVSLVHTPSKKRIHGGGLILEESTSSQVCGSILHCVAKLQI